MDLMKTFGTDAFRLYMYNSNAMLVNDMQFDENGLKESLQQVIIPFWNCASFFQSYAEIDGFKGDLNTIPNSNNKLDQWMLSKLYETEKSIKRSMDNYRVDEYVKPIISLVDNLSNWYIRRSRRRFWGNGIDLDKKNGYETLYYVLTNTCKLLAPITPIIAEKIYKSLTDRESVHLENWPNIEEKFNNPTLIKEVDLIQDIIHLARGIRNKHNIKNRQPLSTLEVALVNKDNIDIVVEYKNIIAEELNVKNIEFISNVEDIATIQYKVNFMTVGKTMGNKIPAITKAIRANQLTLENGKYIAKCDDETIILSKEDILVSYVAKTGKPVLSDEKIVVSLDLTITQELKDEGLARELVRKIQETRKQLDLEITDRILIEINGNYPKLYEKYICEETLGKITTITNEDITVEIEDISIKIKR